MCSHYQNLKQRDEDPLPTRNSIILASSGHNSSAQNDVANTWGSPSLDILKTINPPFNSMHTQWQENCHAFGIMLMWIWGFLVRIWSGSGFFTNPFFFFFFGFFTSPSIRLSGYHIELTFFQNISPISHWLLPNSCLLLSPKIAF